MPEFAFRIADEFANRGSKPTKKHLGLILEKLIGSYSSIRIVVDGLDECLDDHQSDIYTDLWLHTRLRRLGRFLVQTSWTLLGSSITGTRPRILTQCLRVRIA
jgi:hypothetical protein